MVEVAIIGMGSWGLCALERLIDAARRAPSTELRVHVIEPGRPGGGLYARPGPDYLILNTPCGQHSLYPYPEQLEDGRLGLGFHDWAVGRGYRWYGHECRVGGGGRAIASHDFLPRRLMGEYLEWFYEMLVIEAPANVAVAHHKARALDIEATPSGGERVRLDREPALEVDQVILTLGHTEYARAGDKLDRHAIEPYPVERYLGLFSPGEQVAVEGMGLVALDVVTALTVGLGGTYAPSETGVLHYLPSGWEPEIYLFSRTGYPLCAKSIGTADPAGGYQPAICTAEAIAALKRDGPGPGLRAIDARSELLPLVMAEMELRYYTRAAELAQDASASWQVHTDLVSAWQAGTFQQARASYAAHFGDFRAAAHIFAGEGDRFDSAADYQAQVYATVSADVREALVSGGASPVKAALETLRALRDILREAVEFKGLSLRSYLDFQANIQGRLARPVAGPPVFRHQQLLALIDAGVVKLAFGPCPEVQLTKSGRVAVRSTRLAQPVEMTFTHLVRAHLETPAIGRSSSALLGNLARRGRLRPLELEGEAVGSIDLSPDFHPLTATGLEPRLWVFGALTEGARYFSLYIPSPKSRVRAFVDAEICARSIVNGRPELHLQQAVARAEESGAPRRLSIGLVNNMADGAFEETELQFRDLLTGWPGTEVELRCFTLPGVGRAPRVQRLIAERYEDLDDLWHAPPDALVVTGAEPKRAELSDELYWPALERLLWWGRTTVPHMALSCLTAHSALWAFDQLSRRLLPQKCSGVFTQEVDGAHPLMAGVGELALPHSRFNEVPTEDLCEAGYRVVCQSAPTEPGASGWTVAAGARGDCQLLLLQGHPEYARLTLLREYRRDVRRYLRDEQGSYPGLPMGYLDGEAESALEQFRAEVEGEPRDPSRADAFPFEWAASHVNVSWDVPARALVGNWVSAVAGAAPARVAGEVLS